MTLRLELFVNDLCVSQAFYIRVLGFKMIAQHVDGYTPMTNGNVLLSLNSSVCLSENHPIRAKSGQRQGLGVEIVLEVDDVMAYCQHGLASRWPLCESMQERPWGLTDFRIQDRNNFV